MTLRIAFKGENVALLIPVDSVSLTFHRKRQPTLSPRSVYNLFTTSTCELQYDFIPCKPHSTPIPLSLTPPNGCFGDRSKCVFTHTVPASSFRAIRSAVSMFPDHTDAPKPILVLLARAMTSSSVRQERMGTIGPVIANRSLAVNCV
jgi:hypothetical protein